MSHDEIKWDLQSLGDWRNLKLWIQRQMNCWLLDSPQAFRIQQVLEGPLEWIGLPHSCSDPSSSSLSRPLSPEAGAWVPFRNAFALC